MPGAISNAIEERMKHTWSLLRHPMYYAYTVHVLKSLRVFHYFLDEFPFSVAIQKEHMWAYTNTINFVDGLNEY